MTAKSEMRHDSTNPMIKVEGLAQSFLAPDGKSKTEVFGDIWFDIAPGEFVCLIGHSGCGKTTLLNILAGLAQPSDGVVIVGGKEVVGPSLSRAVVFQSHALMPWMSVVANIGFAVRSKWPSMSSADFAKHCQKYIDLVHLTGSETKKPAQLSGGMKQRVGIARALSIEPQTLLLDEPFSALDALTRGSLQDELLAICNQTTQTVFMITHDIDEAILLADTIILMTNGPNARIREVVKNTLPRERTRNDMHKHKNYYPIRNHLIEFLVNRSASFAAEMKSIGYDPKHPPVIEPRTKEEEPVDGSARYELAAE
jgi:nitrate/nitrite transport system ATP-binding protein